MTDEDERELGAELARLQQEHRDLDVAMRGALASSIAYLRARGLA